MWREELNTPPILLPLKEGGLHIYIGYTYLYIYIYIYVSAGRCPPPTFSQTLYPLPPCGVGGWVADIRIIGFHYVLWSRCSEWSQLRNGLRIRLSCFMSQTHVFSICFLYIPEKLGRRRTPERSSSKTIHFPQVLEPGAQNHLYSLCFEASELRNLHFPYVFRARCHQTYIILMFLEAWCCQTYIFLVFWDPQTQKKAKPLENKHSGAQKQGN